MKQKLIQLGKKEKIDIEITEKKNERIDINTMNGKEQLFQISNITSFQIKAIYQKRSILYVTDSLNKPKTIIDHIKTIFQIQENENQNVLCKGNITHRLKEPETIDYNQVKKDFLSLYQLKEKYPEIKTIETTYSHYSNGYYIDNEKCNLEDEAYYNEYGIAITVEKKEKKKVTFINYYTQKYDFAAFQEHVLSKLKNLIIKLKDDTCKTKKYNIILKNDAVALILDTFVNSFHSKEIEQKTSILSDKKKKKIFSNKITIIEDPKNGIEERYFDTEGTETYQKELIKNGIFEMEINNLEYALKKGVTPTGNAYGVNNLYIKEGNTSEGELIKELKDGFIIDEVYGLHSGIDKKSGTISLQAEGLFVENGKITKGLEMVILSTNLFEVFSNVLNIGNQLSHNLLCVSAPSLLLENITIVGKK